MAQGSLTPENRTTFKDFFFFLFFFFKFGKADFRSFERNYFSNKLNYLLTAAISLKSIGLPVAGNSGKLYSPETLLLIEVCLLSPGLWNDGGTYLLAVQAWWMEEGDGGGR